MITDDELQQLKEAYDSYTQEFNAAYIAYRDATTYADRRRANGTFLALSADGRHASGDAYHAALQETEED